MHFDKQSGFPLHLICTTGDPLNPKTWSGTPLRLYEALQAVGRAGAAECPELPRGAAAVENLASKMCGWVPRAGLGDLLPDLLARRRTASCARRLSQTGPVLFMGIRHFPASRPRPRCGVLVDAVWNRWMAAQMPETFARLTPKQKRVMFEMERRVYHAAGHTFTFAQYVREEIIETFDLPPGKITAVGSGFGLPAERTAPAGEKSFDRPRFLFLSKSLSPEKGAELLLEAFSRVRAQCPEAELTLAGHDHYVLRCRDEPGVSGLGYCRPKSPELAELYRRHTHFVLPARNEAWGYVFLEALAMGLPVIGMDENAFPEITRSGKYGWGIPERTPDAVAETMLRALRDPDELAAMSAAAREDIAATYSWEKTAERILRAFGRDA